MRLDEFKADGYSIKIYSAPPSTQAATATPFYSVVLLSQGGAEIKVPLILVTVFYRSHRNSLILQGLGLSPEGGDLLLSDTLICQPGLADVEPARRIDVACEGNPRFSNQDPIDHIRVRAFSSVTELPTARVLPPRNK